jgi:hypothetical protein
MSALTLPQRLAFAEFMAKHFGTTVRKGHLNPEAAAEMEVGERHAAKFGGRVAGWISIPRPAARAAVKNEAALLAWAKKNLPSAVETVERVRPETAKALGDAMKAHGGWVDGDGVVIPVDGIEVTTGEPSPRVELTAEAADVIGEAWRTGEIDPATLLALPAAEPALAPEPWPEPDLTSHLRPPFGDEHGFLNPEKAAMHATVIQGGYSTPPIEAYRMIHDGGAGAERARAWLDAHGLDPGDPREGKDTPWPLPATEDNDDE